MEMSDGTLRPVRDVRRGDRVRVPVEQGRGRAGGEDSTITTTTTATVQCIVKTRTEAGVAGLVRLGGEGRGGGLLVTPYHPVRVGGVWSFPCALGPVTPVACTAVYSVVLDRGHVLSVGGVACVAMGHSFTDDNNKEDGSGVCTVVSHPYFGSLLVRRDLAGMPGYESRGLVELKHDCLRRDPQTGLVCGFKLDRVVVPPPINSTPALAPAQLAKEWEGEEEGEEEQVVAPSQRILMGMHNVAVPVR